MTLQIEYIPIEQLIPYARNMNDHSAEHVAELAASIKEFGWTNPPLIDRESVLVAGHGRVLAARQLGMDLVPCIRRDSWTPAQVKAYRIVDNRLPKNATVNEQVLSIEVQELQAAEFNLSLLGMAAPELSALLNPDGENSGGGGGGSSGSAGGDAYTKKIEAPIYTPKGAKPAVAELFDLDRTATLIAEINAQRDLPDEVAQFLRYAAQRHTVFNYERIAEFYAHASAGVQRLMENSALVIIDFGRAIELGFVALSEELAEAYGDANPE